MPLLPYLVHLGYALMLSAFLAQDVLWLRGLLACAQSVLATYGWTQGLQGIAGWNLVFLSVNAIWVVQILRERRAVQLPPDVQSLYRQHFAALTPPEFLRFWRQGTRERVTGVALARAGTSPESLFFLMSGTVRVTRGGAPIADLSAGFFVAEMSLLTGDPATADADAVGEVELVRWSVVELLAIRQRNPMLWTRIQSVIGHDLVEKIQRQGHWIRQDAITGQRPVSSEGTGATADSSSPPLGRR